MAMVMRREEMHSAVLRQGPHCPFLAETVGNHTWSFSHMLATASGQTGLASTARARARTRSTATRDGDNRRPLHPQVHQHQRTSSPESQETGSIRLSVLWAPSAPCGQEATRMGEGPLPACGEEGRQTCPPGSKQTLPQGTPSVTKETPTLSSELQPQKQPLSSGSS